ncbi:MAG: chemotaxis protein CheA, partial [Acidimicrobiales bacterium]|jgi:two-component system chemotaxis sensor kinase CheA|nr:chemotaxis protein CheA [Acidimicrobiales bacterium]
MPVEPGLEEIVGEFLVESRENLDRLDRELVELEETPDSAELLGSIFRTVHTIKGTAGFFGFARLEAVSHAGENLLSLLRDGSRRLDADITSGLLAMVDAVRTMLDDVEATGDDGEDDHADLQLLLHRLASGEGAGQAIDEPAVPAGAPTSVPADPVPATGSVGADAPTPVAPPDATIRVDVGLLDRLMNLVGELVLARNQLLQFNGTIADPNFAGTAQQLDLITTELQEGVMQTRMQPIGTVWSKLPRVVRDLAASCGKKVRLEMEGEETELDKTLVEAIKDPLTHIVRNSVDHGLETPDVRSRNGKPETGLLSLRSFHEGGQVVIEIADDGGGLNLDRIRAKAVEKGLITPERAAALSERDAAMLIFRPGFSTAEQVTNVSGRGVGMDVVRTNVERIGGTLDVQSSPGRGTTLTIKIPLTLAIIPALIVTTDGDRYLIPQVNLVEVLHVEPEAAAAAIESIGGAPVVRLRGTLLPLISLREVLRLDPPPPAAETGVSVVVLQADGRQFGLVVDRINDTEEIVVKPPMPHIKDLGVYAGTTIMGDGTVSLILDAMGLARRIGLRAHEESGSDRAVAADPAERRSTTTQVLVCDVGGNRIAVPLALVSRLEELAAGTVERTGVGEVVQYRGHLLHLVRLRDLLPAAAAGTAPTPDGDAPLQVLVHESDHRRYGLVVDEIVDVFEVDDLDEGEPVSPDGRRVAVVGRRATDLLDLDLLLRRAGAAALTAVG